eukprot:g9797.t1
MEVEDNVGPVALQQHRFNAQLPYKDKIPAENERLLAEVKDALAKFTADGDFKLLLQACSGLDRMRQLKYAIDDASTLHIARSLYDLAFPAGGEKALPWRCGNKVMYSLAVLLGKKQSQLSLLGKLVLPWRPMLAALEGCALRESPTGSSMTERQRLIALLQLIGQARRYWGRGEDREIWNEFKGEIAQVNAQGAFKALFLLVEFFQSTSSSLYDELLPSWFSLWGQVDHCPAWDGAWLTLLCRARKHVSPAFDWTPYMADIYSFARASIHTPVSVGDAGSAPLMRGRPVAYQYQSFGPPASRSPGAKLNKVAKLMVFLLGKGGPAEPVRVSDVAIVPPAGQDVGATYDGGGSGQRQRTVSPGALELLSLFRSLRTYFHPSNGGRWSLEMGLMVNYVLRGLASRVGAETVLREGGLPLPPTGELTRDDAGLVVEALLPLVLEMVYSKDPSVGSLSNMCLSALASLSPKSVAPAFAELVLRALDPVASINHTHQAPAAIRALTSVFRPLMHPRPFLAPFLPALLELTLPGLDSNDVFKTTVTLQLYHLILCWVPVQGSPVSYSSQALDGWQPSPPPWLDASEVGDADEYEHLYNACEGLGGVMMEWSVAFLDRLFEAAAKGDAVADARRVLMGGSGGVRACPRALGVARASLQHGKRLGVAPRALAYAAKSAADPSRSAGAATAPPWPAAPAVLDRYRSLFSALEQLSSSEYAMVRAAAQVGVNRVGGVFSWFAREAVPGLIGRLSVADQRPGEGGGGEAAHRRLTGALYLLHQTRSMRHVVSKWSLSRSLLLALCDSQSVLARLPADKQEKAAARVTILFNTYVSYWRSNPVETDEDRTEYNALLNGLLERLASFRGSAPSAGGGWRYQLLASWCLMHLIRPNVRPPIAVWHYYTECLSEGDGQPLQRLALGALKRLLLSSADPADPAAPGAGEVSELLRSKAFLHAFFVALAHNHQKQATEGGLAGGDQWSLGVREVLQDSGRGDTRELFPRLRFAARSQLFWARNASLVSAVVSAVGEESRAGCIRVLLEKAKAEQAIAAHEDKRSFDCAAAEVAAGALAVLAGPGSSSSSSSSSGGGWSGREKVLRETVLPFVEAALESVSLDGRLDWTDAIRFALDRSTPEGCEPLVTAVVERTKAVLQDGGKGRDDYSVLVKWLSFLGAVLIELSGREASIPRASSIAKDLCPLLLEGLDHPFKACREEIARNLFLCTHVTDAAWASGMADGVRESILAEAVTVEEDVVEDVAGSIATLSVEDAADTAESALLASALTMSDGSLTLEQEEASTRAAKHLSLRRETVLQWLHQTTGAGDHVRYLPVLVALLPVALQCVRDSNAEVAGMGRGTCLSSAAALTIRRTKDASTTGGGLMSSVLSATSSESWRVRRGAAAVACVLQTRLHFVLEDAQHSAVDTTLLSLLGDPRREVQETARLAVSTRVAHLTAAEARELCAAFVSGADGAAASRKKRRKIAKRKAAAAAGAGEGVAVAAGEPSGAMREQQKNVLGLSAVVLAAPCDVPEWVPVAMESLARHVNDDSPGRLPVRQTVTHTFKEFRRTHQDKWEESHKARFSREQLDTFDDVLGGAHSYFI